MSISTIIPTYNRAELLKNALESVINQTFPPDEVIVVDDGSTDNTEEIVLSFDSQVHYFRQENLGVAAARNVGLRMATGEIITWLDADDLWEINFLATIITELERQPELDGLYSGFFYIDAKGKKIASVVDVVPAENLYTRLIEGNFIVTPSVAIRSQCYEEVGFFDTDLRIGEDADMWMRLAQKFKISGIECPLVSIRIHDQNSLVDYELFIQSLLVLAEKQFGKAAGNPADWPSTKKLGYAFAYRNMAFRALQAGNSEEGWDYLNKAVLIWPKLFCRLDTFYELACGNQIRGYRGQAEKIDVQTNGNTMIEQLDILFAHPPRELAVLHATAYGNAYLSLAMLSDQAGDWQSARAYIRKAARENGHLLKDRSFVRRFVKLHVGKPASRFLKYIQEL
jgi:glycosyltransferase involved in cell wall biosynthesis